MAVQKERKGKIVNKKSIIFNYPFFTNSAITYLMLLEAEEGEEEALDLVLEGPRYALQGFLKHVKLSEGELALLLTCSRARLAQSLTLGAYSYLSQPGNEYILTTQAKGWAVLKRLHEQRANREALLEKWMQPI